MARILIVEDELPLAQAIAYNIKKEGHVPIVAHDGEEALNAFRREQPALILLDILLPTASGLDICRRIRASSAVPIILVTACAEETDRVVGLELGADDYVVKPFSMRELMARVKAVLRRASEAVAAQTDSEITCGNIVIDPARREVTVDGRQVPLTRLEFDLLLFLATHPGRVFDRTTLLDRVWGDPMHSSERTVDVHIRWLREKVEADPGNPRHILTVRGVGYKMVCE